MFIIRFLISGYFWTMLFQYYLTLMVLSTLNLCLAVLAFQTVPKLNIHSFLGILGSPKVRKRGQSKMILLNWVGLEKMAC